jgi:hypothetical protein
MPAKNVGVAHVVENFALHRADHDPAGIAKLDIGRGRGVQGLGQRQLKVFGEDGAARVHGFELFGAFLANVHGELVDRELTPHQ